MRCGVFCLYYALTLMLLLDAFEAIAYAVASDANADAKISNVARHLGGAYALLMLPPLFSMLMLLRQQLRADDCDDMMLKCVCICARLCLSTVRVCVMFVHVPLCVRAFTLRRQLHSKIRHFRGITVEVIQKKRGDRIGCHEVPDNGTIGGGEGLP